MAPGVKKKPFAKPWLDKDGRKRIGGSTGVTGSLIVEIEETPKGCAFKVKELRWSIKVQYPTKKLFLKEMTNEVQQMGLKFPRNSVDYWESHSKNQSPGAFYNDDKPFVSWMGVYKHEMVHVEQFKSVAREALLGLIKEIETQPYPGPEKAKEKLFEYKYSGFTKILQAFDDKIKEKYPIREAEKRQGFLPGQEGEPEAVAVERKYYISEINRMNSLK